MTAPEDDGPEGDAGSEIRLLGRRLYAIFAALAILLAITGGLTLRNVAQIKHATTVEVRHNTERIAEERASRKSSLERACVEKNTTHEGVLAGFAGFAASNPDPKMTPAEQAKLLDAFVSIGWPKYPGEYQAIIKSKLVTVKTPDCPTFVNERLPPPKTASQR